MTYFWPDALVTVEDTPRRIAAVRLAFTMYLAEPEFWCVRGLQELYDRFLQATYGHRVDQFHGSGSPGWKTLRGTDHRHVREAQVSQTSKPRHQLDLRFFDETPVPNVGLHYREVRAESGAVGFAQWVFPPETSLERMWELACWVSDALPIWSLVGGYTLIFDQDAEVAAFNHGYALSRRFRGIDLQHPERFARYARTGLPSTNWITVLGARLAETCDLDAHKLPRDLWPSNIALHASANGTFALRAGTGPELGDLNLMDYPNSIAEVSKALRSALIQSPPSFPGAFETRENLGSTLRWIRRFVDEVW